MNLLLSLIFIVSIAADQITKMWAVTNLKGNMSVNIIGNFLKFTYAENRGAAFSILQDKRIFFITVTFIMLTVVLYMLIYNKKITNLTKISLILISGGAVGNLIDRIRVGYVIDFIDVRFGDFYDFPIFNIADSFVVVGTALLIILILTDKFEREK